MRVIIVGGVAGGASCAARLRRLDEKAEIIMVERGPYMSYANCGLPYHISGVIAKESSLMVANEQFFRTHFAIDARTNCEAISISAKKKTVDLRDVATGEVTTEYYDKLVLSPGAPSVRPAIPGIDLPGIFQVQDRARCAIDPRMDRTRHDVPRRDVQLFGNPVHPADAASRRDRWRLHRPRDGGEPDSRGFEVTLLEMLDQVLAPLDREFALLVEEHVKQHGLRLALGDGVAGFKSLARGAIEVRTKSGKKYPADIVILALGVRPDTTLAKSAGLAIGERGGIRVDEHMRTSNPDIFAVGDAVEVRDFVTGEWSLVALAGPANRQGRIAADVIAGRDSRFRGTQGTSIIGLFGAAAAWTGASEKTLKRQGDDDYEKIYLFPNSHAGYYPDAKPIALKFIFRKSDGRVLGAQALGQDGPAVDKRISAHRRRDPDGRDDLRPRGSRAVLRATVRKRQGRSQFRGHDRRRRP